MFLPGHGSIILGVTKPGTIAIFYLEHEISEYEDLTEGRLLSFGAGDLDSPGELITKARIACALAWELKRIAARPRKLLMTLRKVG
jgi:hypothetical protein